MRGAYGNAAAHLIKGVASELDDVEGTEDAGGRSAAPWGARPSIKDLDLYPQPPTNTRLPALNSEEPINVAYTPGAGECGRGRWAEAPPPRPGRGRGAASTLLA